MDYILLILGVLFLITCFILWKIRKINPKKQIFKSLFQSGSEAEAEEIFYSSDIGPKMTKKLLSFLQEGQSLEALKHNLVQEFLPIQNSLEKIKFPYVAIFVGINGAGKTTSIGKLAYKFFLQKKKGIIIAADTFRAAAPEQLLQWAKISSSEFLQGKQGQEPASLVYEGLEFFLKHKLDYCLIDTAGRLQNNKDLISELLKIKKVMQKLVPDLKTETFLIIDAMNGLHALRQTEGFHKDIGVDSVIYTKIDGSSKAGSLISVLGDFKIPVRYLGVGEGKDDLYDFDLNSYLNQIF